MKINEACKSALYKAVAQNVTNIRIEIAKNPDLDTMLIDEMLTDLEAKIWEDIKLALNLDNAQ